jgi:membrane associated rhomboid family serine protease
VTTCYRHPDREANIRCQRCERPICASCMIDAAVGFQCPTCVAEGRKSVRQPRTMAGALVPASAGAISIGLIVVNVAALLAEMVNPAVDDRGAMVGAAVASGEYWRLLTSAFLHAGPLHLLLNMYALYLFGPVAERALGTTRFILTYLTMALSGSVAVYWFAHPHQATVGASGAIFGLFGLVLVLMIKAGQDVRTLMVLLVINGIFSLSPGISWQAHLGGFLAGLILGAVFAYAPRPGRTLWQMLAFAGLWVAMVAAILARTAQLTSGITPL